MANTFYWNSEKTPESINRALKTLSVRYPRLKGCCGDYELVFERSSDESVCSVRQDDMKYIISGNRDNMILRMVGSVLSGVIPETADYYPFNMFGIMIDCSRNAVMTVDYMKSYLERLAILGYNMVMLYTEDTYKIEGEPFFGLMRGAYTEEEIRELDEYAYSLGIEMIPCIQTLAHLEQIFRWSHYNEINDCNGILLVDEQKTYDLIEKMIATW